MKSLSQRIVPSLSATLLSAIFATQAGAIDVSKANNTDALNLTSSWSLATAPTSSDIAVWDATVTGANAVNPGANLNWAGIKITSPGGAVTINSQNYFAAGTPTQDQTTDTFTLANTFVAGDIVTLAGTTVTNGAANGTYYVVNPTSTTFQLATTPGGTPINYTANNTAQTAAGPYALTLGASGIDMSAATQNLTINSVVSVGASQTWNVGASRTLTAAVLIGTNAITKSGAGTLVLGGISNSFSGGVNVTAGTLNLTNSTGAGTGTITLGDASTLNIGNASTFAANAVTVSGTNANVSITTSNATGGYSGAVTGTSDQTLTIGGTVAVNFSSTTKQLQNFAGTVTINSGATLAFRSSALNNGGDNATFEVNGALNSRNNGFVALGALSGSGTVTMGTSGGNNANLLYTIGAKNINSTFSGTIIDGDTVNGKRVAITKIGTGTLTLSGTNTYSGGTIINNGAIALGASNTLLSTGNLALGGGKLDLAGFSQTLGTLTLTAATTSTIDFGTGTSTLLFSSITGTGNLNVLNFTEGTDSFRVTADPTALLTKITVNGLAATATDMSGYWAITASAVPEPSTYAALAGLSILGFAAYRRRRA